MRFITLLFSLVLLVQDIRAQQATDLLPEAQGAKALLEDLIARRYRQELTTLIDASQFSLGARLELTKVEDTTPTLTPSKEHKEIEVPYINDLMLGTLDPEELLKSYSSPEQAEIAKQFLDHFRIKSVTISVGLKEGLPKVAKTNVEKWLNERVSKEFGKNGSGQVLNTLQPAPLPELKPLPPTNKPLDLLNQFQSLAGQLVLALALLLGVILWRLLGGGKSENREQHPGPTINMSGVATGTPPETTPSAETEMLVNQKLARENQTALQSIHETTKKILEILPHITPHFETIVRSWCQMDDPGRFRLAVLAEAVGKEIGRLPIPIDALPEVGKVFSRVLELPLQEKLDHLQKSYWDLLSVMNLGPEILNKPFAYLGGINTGAVSQLLVDKNAKLKTLVSLYMPAEQRTRYFKGLDSKVKLELLQQASQMDSIPAEELNSIDSTLKEKMQVKSSKGVVVLDRAFHRIVEALTPQEELALLTQIKNDTIEAYKRSIPSLAFLGEWPDDKLKLFLSKVTADELLPYLRLLPISQKRFFALLPQMTSEVLRDELAGKDRTNSEEKGQWLLALKARMTQMFELKELVLDDIFAKPQDHSHDTQKAS